MSNRQIPANSPSFHSSQRPGKQKITKDTVATIQLPAGKVEHIVYDTEIHGFGLRIREGGSRVFIYQYKIGTKNRRLTLGTAAREAFPGIRERVLQLQAKVRLGTDPANVKETGRQQAAETFKAIADRYLAQHQKSVKRRTHLEDERYLLIIAKPLHGMPIAGIQRRHIAETLSAAAANVTKGSGEVTANRLRSKLSAMFVWAMKEGIVEHNPVVDTNKRSESPRDRVLTDAELVAIWNTLDDTAFGDAVRLLILTGQRRNEIGGLRWDELDEELTRITLPKHRSKNGLEHIIPLSEPSRNILTGRYRVVGQAGVFSSSDAGYAGWNRGKKTLDQRLQLPHWTLHDIRRSVATGMAKRGVLPHVIEAVLNHVSGHKAGVAGIYNRNTYEPEKRQALTLWAEHLMSVISSKPAKIVPLKVA